MNKKYPTQMDWVNREREALEAIRVYTRIERTHGRDHAMTRLYGSVVRQKLEVADLLGIAGQGPEGWKAVITQLDRKDS